MKKVLAMILCGVMLLMLTACGDAADGGKDGNTAPSVSNEKANDMFEDGLEAFADVLFLGDADALDDFVPQGIWEYYFDSRNNDVTMNDCEAWLNANKDKWQKNNEQYGVGEVTDVTFEIIEVAPWTEDEIENFKKWEDMYGVEMTDGYSVEVKFTIKGTDGTTTETLPQDMYKSGDEYYVYTAVANADSLVANVYYDK